MPPPTIPPPALRHADPARAAPPPAPRSEIVQRRPHEFKIACLEDIRALFPPDWNPFYAGFGNRDTDVVSYREVGVPPGRTFIINPKGQICKGSSVLQSSSWSSLSAINTLVDEVFPAVQVRRRWECSWANATWTPVPRAGLPGWTARAGQCLLLSVLWFALSL